MAETVFPGAEWERADPEAAGLDPDGLRAAERWQRERLGDDPSRIVVVRGGRLVFEASSGMGADERVRIASAAKSVYSSVLAIAVEEGVIPSADAKVVDVFPRMMDVPEGQGPKPGRFARPKDRGITFRQLIGNTSGYLKPDEKPGEHFHYQTFGMNILTHAVAAAYGLYDAADPEGSPGFARLVAGRIAEPIGAEFDYALTNFPGVESPALGVFGYYTQVLTNARDAARLGWLWCNAGRWGDRQVIPGEWMREATGVSREVREHEPHDRWQYGLGFWTNEAGELWPGLPTDGFAALGAGGHTIVVFPSLELVVATVPGFVYPKESRGNPEFLKLIVDSVRE